MPGASTAGTGTFEPLDAKLQAIAALTGAANKVAYFTGAATLDVADFTAAGRTLAGGANAAAQILSLGLSPHFNAYAVGTAYSLTNAAAALTFGTTQPAITLTTAGTYRLKARVNLQYNAATFAAVRTITLKLRRTNNTAADVSNSSTSVTAAVVTTLSGTLLVVELPEVVYTTALTTDAVTIFGLIDVVPTAGSLDVVEASIHAVRVA